VEFFDLPSQPSANQHIKDTKPLKKISHEQKKRLLLGEPAPPAPLVVLSLEKRLSQVSLLAKAAGSLG